MKKVSFLIGILFTQCLVFAQFRITFIIDSLPSYHQSGSPVYLVGNFNNWNPKHDRFQLEEREGRYGITIELPSGMVEYKFTKGSWDNVESSQAGLPTANRRLKVMANDTVHIVVQHWADHFPKQTKQSTASKNVHVIDTAFLIPQLNRHRRIWIYLPADYEHSDNKYPVLYMHDGQNLFDEATAAYGEWGVDEALDTLGPLCRQMIVVGIDNGEEKRINEYSPYDMEKYGKGEGDQYLAFLVKTLKPFIDQNYRTRKSKDDTFIAGSSMGGLISFYAILKYPGIFGAAGVFSPAFWITPELKNIDPEKAKKLKGKIYFYAGNQESETMVPDMLHVFRQMQTHSKAKMETVIRSEGRHDENTWREEFVKFYEWLYPLSP